MVRTLTLPLRDNLVLKKKAVEPIVVLGIEWTPGNEILYADRKINGADQPFPILNKMGRFTTSQIVAGSGSSQSVPVVFDDIDSTLETIINTDDIHKAKARVYLTVQGIDVSNRTLLFQGEINSPLKWDEGARTLEFDIISEIESVEVGFAIEDGDFPQVPEELRGKDWPMVFGDVCWMKSVQVRAPRKGFLTHPQGVIDFTLNDRLCQARLLTCAQKFEPPRSDGDRCMTFRDNRTGRKGCICPDLPFGQCATIETEKDKIDLECLNRRFNEICRLIDRLAQEEAKVVNPMTIRGGNNFPQSQRITINIGGVLFIGVFTGESFLYDTVTHPQRDEINNPPCKRIGEAVYGFRRNASKDGWQRVGKNKRSFEYVGTPLSAGDCAAGGEPINKVIEGPGESWRYYEQFKEADFIGLPEGAEVFLEEEAEILHVCNLFGGTVTGVAAYRTYGSQTILVNLPTNYYNVRLTDYGDYPDILELSLTKPLKSFKDENWESDIYVKVSSPVGPNPADCIKFLVDTYLATSGITMNMDSYTSVKAKLTNYPTNFHVKARPSVFNLIGDIAHQSRCAAVIRDGELVLIYLSEKPTAIRTLTMADIIPQTVSITHGDTEDLKTRHDIKWQKFEASIDKDDDPERRLLLKWNVPLYGTFEVNYDYFTQNTFETIQKSATFWLIRESTTWKRISFSTPLTQIDLDAFDAIALNIPHFTTNITVIIEDASYNADNHTIEFRCWTPVRAGEDAEYIWAWPAQQGAKEIFPVQGLDEGREGDALGFVVSPPIGHVLSGGFSVTDPSSEWVQVQNQPQNAAVQTTGDRFPSDLDDTLPDINCPAAQDDLGPVLDPFAFADFKEIANRQDDHFENNQDSFGGAGGSTEDDQESKGACGDPNPGGFCTYEVSVGSITPQAITTFQTEGSPCPAGGPCGCPGTKGRPCFGPTAYFCHTFGARFSAESFAAQKQSEAQALFDNCGYQCGVSDLWNVGGVRAVPGSGGFGGCEGSPGDPENDNGDGEINSPTEADGPF